MLCIYHRIDFDGKCSAAIVRNKYPDCRLYGIDYIDEFDIEQIDTGEEVFMVDFTVEPSYHMSQIKEKSGKFHWIDHHKTIIDVEDELDAKDWLGVREIETSEGIKRGACELVWEYLYPNNSMPYSVYLLSRYDVWEIENPLWEDVILPFQYGMRAKTIDMDDLDFWKKLIRSVHDSMFIEQTTRDGRIALKYAEELDGKMAKGLWFPMEFEGLKFQVINRGFANSISASAIWDRENYDAVMFFCRGRDKWKITMFTDHDIDLSEIATRWGGGGHEQACGFSSIDLYKDIPQLLKF